jgi:transcriptional regulator with XRE-family HTH domain
MSQEGHDLTHHASDGGGVQEDLIEVALMRAIAQRVKEERQRLNFTLREVARRSDVSVAMISKIEQAQTSPSLRTLSRLANALDVPITTFFRGFEEEREASYVKAGEGIELIRKGTRHGHRYELLAVPKSGGRLVQPFLNTMTNQAEAFPLFQHEYSEFIYMLEGQMLYSYGQHSYELEPGDSLLFDGATPHGIEELKELPVKFLSVHVDPEQRNVDQLLSDSQRPIDR